MARPKRNKNKEALNDKKYSIIKDRVEIYKDFTLNLFYYINHYYLDDKSLSKDVDINNHFNFCFNKTCEDFLKENIDFRDNKELKNYFRKYYYHQFYKAQSNPEMDVSVKYFENVWNEVFDIDNLRNKKIAQIFIALYNVFDETINKEKNLLDIIS